MPIMKALNSTEADSQTVDFVTVKVAADTLKLPSWKLRRAVKAGVIPCYTFFNKRRLVRISEIIQIIERTSCGGAP